jgi:hypothetical protein
VAELVGLRTSINTPQGALALLCVGSSSLAGRWRLGIELLPGCTAK